MVFGGAGVVGVVLDLMGTEGLAMSLVDYSAEAEDW